MILNMAKDLYRNFTTTKHSPFMMFIYFSFMNPQTYKPKSMYFKLKYYKFIHSCIGLYSANITRDNVVLQQ